MPTRPSAFDEQATRYDARVGLPESVGAAVAAEIMARAGLQPDDLVLELGAGTGEIGTHLARLPVRYGGMLRISWRWPSASRRG